MRNGQNGRRRGRGGPPRAPSGGRSPDMGNRNEVRVRGNAHQLLEKYKQLARDASMQGDRVTAEYYMQYADHYYRVLNEFRARQEEQQARFQQHNRQRNDYDGDEGDDGDEIEGAEPIRVSEMTRTIPEPQRDSAPRSEDGRHDGDDQHEARSQREPRQHETRGERENGRRDGGRRNNRRDAIAADRDTEDQDGSAEAAAAPGEGEQEAPRRRGRPRGRPRRDAAPEGAADLAPVEA